MIKPWKRKSVYVDDMDATINTLSIFRITVSPHIPMPLGLGRVPGYPRFGSGKPIIWVQIYYSLPEC